MVGRSNWNGSAIVCYLFLPSPWVGVGLLRDATGCFETQYMAAWMFRGPCFGEEAGEGFFLRVKWLQPAIKGMSSVRRLGLGAFLSRIFPLCFAPSGCSCKNSSMRILKLWWQITLEWLHNWSVFFSRIIPDKWKKPFLFADLQTKFWRIVLIIDNLNLFPIDSLILKGDFFIWLYIDVSHWLTDIDSWKSIEKVSTFTFISFLFGLGYSWNIFHNELSCTVQGYQTVCQGYQTQNCLLHLLGTILFQPSFETPEKNSMFARPCINWRFLGFNVPKREATQQRLWDNFFTWIR